MLLLLSIFPFGHKLSLLPGPDRPLLQAPDLQEGAETRENAILPPGTSLVVQWLRLQAPKAGGLASIAAPSPTGFLPTAQGPSMLLCQPEGIMGQISKPLAHAQRARLCFDQHRHCS